MEEGALATSRMGVLQARAADVFLPVKRRWRSLIQEWRLRERLQQHLVMEEGESLKHTKGKSKAMLNLKSMLGSPAA